MANERAAVSREVLELSASGPALARRIQVDQVFVDSGGGSRYRTESLLEVRCDDDSFWVAVVGGECVVIKA